MQHESLHCAYRSSFISDFTFDNSRRTNKERESTDMLGRLQVWPQRSLVLVLVPVSA